MEDTIGIYNHLEDTIGIIKQAEEIVKQTTGEVVPNPGATPFFSSPGFTIAAFVLSLICVALLVLLFLYYRRNERSDDDIKDLILDSLRHRDRHISQAVLNLVRGDDELLRRVANQEHSNVVLSKNEIEQIVRQELERIVSEKRTIKENSVEPELIEQIEKATHLNLLLSYASTVNKDKNCFYEVTKTPKNDTIFVLELNPEDESEATFTVYDKVFKKVIQEQGHINGGCVIENPDMNNTSVVKTIEPGLTRLVDGKWIIEEKSKVKFE